MTDLDTRWIEDTENELENANPTNHVRKSQNSITTTFVYMNTNDSIDKVITETHELAKNATLTYEQILQFIQQKKTTPAAKYKIVEILLYVVDLEPSQISQYANSPEFREISAPFMKICPVYNEIEIAETLSIFHKVNAVYFLFKEKQKITPPSILKTDSQPKKTRKHHNTRAHTKRVLFRE